MASVAGGRITHGVGANLIGIHSQARNQEATLYVGNLDSAVDEELLWVRISVRRQCALLAPALFAAGLAKGASDLLDP